VTTAAEPALHILTRRQHGIIQPNAHGVIDPNLKPANHDEALRIPHWHAAMDLDFQVLLHNETWYLVPPCLSLNIIDSKWVFKTKRHADGSMSAIRHVC
jgi:hypothetical protein